MSLEFLSTSPAAPARSPMERQAEAAGATFELRDGWRVAAGFGDGERSRLAETVGFADSTPIGKFELHERHDLPLGLAERREGAWWCPLTAERALVICEPAATAELRERLGPRAVEVTSSYAALTIAGPLSRELFARFCAIDLRPKTTPVHGWRPGSVARTPGAVLREDTDRFLMLFGFALGEYMWQTVADAAAQLGGGPVGIDALVPLEEELLHA
jgi:glycine cleavage system aminomethyltransferase T